MGREHDDEINPEKVPLPIAWTKWWTGNSGKKARVFHVTMGSAKDYQSAGLRRLTVNAAYWGLGLEKHINSQSSVDYVDEQAPGERIQLQETGSGTEKASRIPLIASC